MFEAGLVMEHHYDVWVVGKMFHCQNLVQRAEEVSHAAYSEQIDVSPNQSYRGW